MVRERTYKTLATKLAETLAPDVFDNYGGTGDVCPNGYCDDLDGDQGGLFAGKLCTTSGRMLSWHVYVGVPTPRQKSIIQCARQR